MNDNYTWGPWIEHDGDPKNIKLPYNYIDAKCDFGGEGLRPDGKNWYTDHPCFQWKLRRKSFWSSEKVPVCENSLYAPITRYRFAFPASSVKASAGAEQLRVIAVDPENAKVIETEEPKRVEA